MNNQDFFTELKIPDFVWKFVRSIMRNPIQAGILAFIIYNFLKDKETKKESIDYSIRLNSLVEIRGVDEKEWEKAKKAFKKSYGKEPTEDRDFAIVMSIYKKMTESLQEVAEPAKEEDVDPEELAMGIEVEMEHTDDKEEAKKIALQHLAEVPDYYSKLKKYVEPKERLNILCKRLKNSYDKTRD